MLIFIMEQHPAFFLSEAIMSSTREFIVYRNTAVWPTAFSNSKRNNYIFVEETLLLERGQS